MLKRIKNLIRVQVLACAMASMWFVSCMDCDTEGCDALPRSARVLEIDQGLAGACVFLGDVVEEYLGQTCQECPLGREWIYLWHTDSPVSSEYGALQVCSTPPLLTIECDGRYEARLDAGDYMLCESAHDATTNMVCLAFVVRDDGITTFNTASMGWLPMVYLSKPDERPVLVEQPIMAECSWE